MTEITLLILTAGAFWAVGRIVGQLEQQTALLRGIAEAMGIEVHVGLDEDEVREHF